MILLQGFLNSDPGQILTRIYKRRRALIIKYLASLLDHAPMLREESVRPQGPRQAPGRRCQDTGVLLPQRLHLRAAMRRRTDDAGGQVPTTISPTTGPRQAQSRRCEEKGVAAPLQ